MAVRVQIVVDCSDPEALARFWAFALDYEVQEGSGASWAAAEDPDGTGPRLYFQPVPEGKVVKNRLHIDVNAGGPRGTPDDERARKVDTAVARLVGGGAKQVSVKVENGERWVLMLDPENNEFCVQ